MRRVIVAGARGFFGAAVVEILRADGCALLTSSRRDGCDLTLDLEDRVGIRTTLRARDVIVDATAPFHARTTTLVEEAVTIGFDVVDLCDNLDYARRVAAFDQRARERGVSLFTACSSVSVLSALAVERSGLREPIAVHGFLAPATRHTANRGVAESFLSSIGVPIEIWRGGAWARARGWTQSRTFAALRRSGRLIETADALTLPRICASLRDVDFWVDPNIRGARVALALAVRVPAVVPWMARLARYGRPIGKALGSDRGVLAYEVVAADGRAVTVMFTGRRSYLMAALPAALAVRRLAWGARGDPGVVPADRHVPWPELLDGLADYGIEIELQVNIAGG